MSLTAEQRHWINVALRLSQGAPTKVRKSLLEAMAVESGYRNLNYGDRDSQGLLQQRPSQGWGPAGHPKQDIRQYLNHAMSVYNGGFRGSAGDLAQAVQRSAFPDRYDEHRREANRLLRGAAGGGPPGGFRAPQTLYKPGGYDLEGSTQQGLQSLMSGSYDPMEALGDLVAGFQPGEVIHKGGRFPGGGGPGGGSDVVRAAAKQLGQKYVWGGESRKEGGFDCSGLIYWAYRKVGITLPRTAAEQLRAGRRIGFKQLRPGDLIAAKDGHHIVMYVGHGKVIAAPHTGAVVEYQPLSYFNSSAWQPVRIDRR